MTREHGHLARWLIPDVIWRELEKRREQRNEQHLSKLSIRELAIMAMAESLLKSYQRNYNNGLEILIRTSPELADHLRRIRQEQETNGLDAMELDEILLMLAEEGLLYRHFMRRSDLAEEVKA